MAVPALQAGCHVLAAEPLEGGLDVAHLGVAIDALGHDRELRLLVGIVAGDAVHRGVRRGQQFVVLLVVAYETPTRRNLAGVAADVAATARR
jgi:hypothetical protein